MLPRVVTGGCVLAVALNETGAAMPAQPGTALRRDGARLLLSGRKLGVSHLEAADLVLVTAWFETGQGTGVEAGPGTSLERVTGRGARLSGCRTPGARTQRRLRTARRSLARRRHGSHARPRRRRGCWGGLLGAEAAATLRRHAVAGLCLFGDGVIAGARDLTAEYVRGRRQFGRMLAEFQAVSAQMADVYIASRTIGLAAVSAAWRVATGLDADDDLAVAAYWFTAEGPAALQTCHHLHGGMGVDVTYPLHAYFSWAKDISRALGGTHQTLEAVAASAPGRS